jgi:hypothetical protein
MTNHAPTSNGYKPSAPLSTLIKRHGTGDEAEEVVQSRRQKATRTGQPTRQQNHLLLQHGQSQATSQLLGQKGLQGLCNTCSTEAGEVEHQAAT